MSLMWEKIPGPLPFYHTGSDEKLSGAWERRLTVQFSLVLWLVTPLEFCMHLALITNERRYWITQKDESHLVVTSVCLGNWLSFNWNDCNLALTGTRHREMPFQFYVVSKVHYLFGKHHHITYHNNPGCWCMEGCHLATTNYHSSPAFRLCSYL